MNAVVYTPSHAAAWDAFVKTSRNGTFLFERAFMDYHADRFTDVSLIFIYKGKIMGVLPATCVDGAVISHGGLTYGGFVVAHETHAVDVGEMMRLAIDHYRAQGFLTLHIKPVPSIYHRYPSDDELYWLFRNGAMLETRGLSSAVDLRFPLPFSTLRRRKVNKAKRDALVVKRGIPASDRTSWATYWDILTSVLSESHGRKPVHTLDEMMLLKDRFPNNIELWTTVDGNGGIIAGTVLFISAHVVHAQYIAASESGKESGGLDFLFDVLISHFRTQSILPELRYLDFGISTEDGGRYLNEGLAFQKEGLGGRSVVYDAYCIKL